MVNLGQGQASILDDLVERLLGAVQQILGDLLELGAGQGLIQEERVLLGVHRDVRQVDVGGLGGGQLNLGLLSSLTQTLDSALILGQVNALGSLELIDEPVDNALVPVVTTELVVTSGSHDLNNAVTDLQQGDVEGTATEVEDQDGLLLLALLQAISQRGGSRLVNDTQDVEACNLAGLLGGLALGILEVSRDGNDGVGNVLTQVSLGVALQLHERAGRNLLRGVLLVIDIDGPVGADVALDGANGAVNIGDRLVLGGLANENFAVLGKSHDGRGGAGTLGVSDNGCLATFQHGYNRVGGTKVNSYCASHNLFSLRVGVCFKLIVRDSTSAASSQRL